MNQLDITKADLIREINQRVEDKILEPNNAELLRKLVSNSDSINEAISIAQLGTFLKQTGFQYDIRLEKTRDIRYFKKNTDLSFHVSDSAPTHKLIIGDNYDALQNLLIEYRGKIDVIYIDPPYSKDSMGDFAKTNYTNGMSRDNLLSMMYPRLMLAKRLLSPDGVIFCSIDDRNQSYIKCVFDDVFTEKGFLFCLPRITKKGGKTTATIQKNHDYILGYTTSLDIVFEQLEKDMSSFDQEDEYVNERGKYKLTQTLDYGSLSYSQGMDYPIEYNGKTYYPGGSKEAWEKRQKGDHRESDWTWRWQESAFSWGIENGLIVLRGDRFYTKTYAKCRKKRGVNELEFFEPGKAFTTLSYLENEFSNDNGKKELDKIFPNSDRLFKNPKPSALIKQLVKMVCDKDDAIILDFFAGSGSTLHAVADLNSIDTGKRQAILCQINEKTNENPNGIAYDVTTKRVKRILTGKCYDNSTEFSWINNNSPYMENLDVYELTSVHDSETVEGKTAVDVIDETLYGKEKFSNLQDKIEWICEYFAATEQKIK
jgi:adenine-specific DNA-methyltransferase